MIRVTDKHVFFWSGWPSNWHPSIFTAEYEGKEYEFHNAEQYFMFVKAKTFGDDEIAERIINEGKDPKVAKALGREVKNYDDKVWNEMRYKIMVDANKAKFGQNKELADLITSEEFKGKGMVEASPLDRVWGVGLTENDPLADDEKYWLGQNLLGKALDEVRTWLLKDE